MNRSPVKNEDEIYKKTRRKISAREDRTMENAPSKDERTAAAESFETASICCEQRETASMYCEEREEGVRNGKEECEGREKQQLKHILKVIRFTRLKQR